MKKYQARIISTSLAMIFILFWDYIFYYIEKNPINWPVDILFSAVVIFSVWMMAYYFDQKQQLIEKVQESERKYKYLSNEKNRIMDNLQEIVFQTNAKGEITYLNQAWVIITGYSIKECMGTMYNDYFIKEKHVVDYIGNQIRIKASSGTFNAKYVTKAGVEFWGEVHYKLYYDKYHRFTGSLGTLSDITERKNAEEKLFETNERLAMQSQKLAIAGELAAGIAHEVRNPLTSVSGFLQLMKTQYPDRTDYFDIIFSEIKRIDLVLGELLLLAKPQTVTFKPHKINGILKQVTTLLDTNAVLSNIVIEKNFNLTESCKINGDENQLKQVFINIIKNGIEAMPAGGVINISSEKKGSYTIISIKDQGSGMTKENMKQIGEPFFSTKEKGTGLGLPICLRILKEHKGELKIESESGKGSTFYVILPLESDK
ncbi:ATP-binding protein [Bacillus atrophaeus]|uniref:ATP-binding protein n=1 Tax=Bacillus atrophaeus TaxID=1452 RepID=UPI001EFA7DE5|nr:ATP-binding protein [Bacillus atrophaeus]MCG8395414.1 ATP-binding protein [Bacillus atrophaeus]